MQIVGLRRLLDLRIGIAGRLGISFAAVGILAAITNLIVEQGISVIETTRFQPAPLPFIVSLPDPVPAPVPEPRRQMVDTDRLTLAVDQYERAIAVRAQSASAESDAEVVAAERDLTATAASVTRKVEQGAQRELDTALKIYRESGTQLLMVADQRRTTISAYAAHLESMNERMGKSVDGAWKILGRVVARQSLLQLRNDHDEIRRQFAALSSAATVAPAVIDSLIRSEAAFGNTLEANERSLTRSEGPEWMSLMKAELGQIRTLRETLVDDWQNMEIAETRFSQGRAAARSVLQKLGERGRVEARPVVVPPPFVGPPILAVDPEANIVPATQTKVSTQATDSSKRRLVAWLSGGVLIIVLLISIATVRSIVVPIRRLLKATSQLGKGNLHEPVPRGGIKELDTLALSFNQMADEVIAARKSTEEHQLELERRVVERTRQLQELAERDPLTGLPNRRHLLALLNEALKNARLNKHLVGVFFLDLDNFKNINDSMGHAFGDRVLVAISQRLREITVDFGFAARLGGDEFTVVLTDGKNVEDVRNAGMRVIAAFQNPISVDNRDLVISVSAGASIYPDHEQTAEGLLQAADAALFRAKALGRSQLSVFTPELLAAAAAKFTTEQGLRRAVERGEFELVFQPEISSDTLQTALVEALIRWRLPDGRLALPSEFLAVAEESGLIVEISDWVLRSAIRTAAGWHHGAWPEARVAINVSARQLLDHRFVERVQSLLQEFKLPARCIEIELTETVLQTGLATIDTLHRLRACGIAIALDDFGAGYSSLASVEHLPFTRIKLDSSLIAGIDTSARSEAITRAIVGLCHGLNLEVTAEGVERPEQLAMLLSHRPIYLQGYLFSQAVAVDELVPTLARIAEEVPLLLVAARNPAAESSRIDVPSARRRRPA